MNRVEKKNTDDMARDLYDIIRAQGQFCLL